MFFFVLFCFLSLFENEIEFLFLFVALSERADLRWPDEPRCKSVHRENKREHRLKETLTDSNIWWWTEEKDEESRRSIEEWKNGRVEEREREGEKQKREEDDDE